MKIFVRFKGHAFKEFILEEGKRYSVGRGTSCDIHLPYSQISRDQGFIFFDEDSWVFEDHGATPPRRHRLSEVTAAHLKNGLEIFSEEFLDQELTHSSHAQIGHPFHFWNMNLWKNKKFWASASLASLLLVLGLWSWNERNPTIYNSQTLMGYAENKVVKFELKFNPANIEKVKAAGEFTDEDIRKNIGFCTGFIIAKNIVLTALHCLAQPPGFSILDDFNILTKDNRQLTPKKILGFDFVKDYLFLEVEGLEGGDKPLKFANKFDIGEKVFTIGNVAGEGIAIREGIIAGVTEDPNDPQVEYIRFSAAASPGNSGGPLLNERGEIVALVSKKNFAENYNIGIRFQDLKSGFQDFVKNPGSREIIYSSAQNDLEIVSLVYLFPRLFGFKAADAFASRKEISQKFTDFRVNFQVPFDFEDRQAAYSDKIMTEAKKLVDGISAELKAQDLPSVFWETQATKEMKVIAPVVAEELRITFKKLGKDLFVPTTTGLVGHSGYGGYSLALSEWKKNRNYSYPDGIMAQRVSLLEHRIQNDPSKGYLVYSSVEDKKEPLDLTSMFYMSPDFTLVYLKDWPKEERQKLISETAKDIFFSDSGAHLNLKIFPYLRSKAKSDLKLTEFPEELSLVKSIPDRHGRKWDYYRSDFYGAFFVELFCGDFPQSTHCLTVVRDGDVKNVRLPLVENFVETEFSEKFPLLDFYNPTNISSLGHDSEVLFKKAQLETTKDGVLVAKGILGNQSYHLKTNQKIELIRPRAAVIFSPEGAKWQTTGFNFIQSKGGPDSKYELCTTGVEFEEYKTNSLLHMSDSDLTRMVASLSGSSPGAKDKSARFWRKDLRSPASEEDKFYLYGSCFPLIPQQNRPDTFTVDPYKGKPLPIEVINK